MKSNDLILYGAIGLGAYLLLSSQSTPAAVTYIPGTTTPVNPQPASNPLSSLLSLPSSLISNLTGSSTALTTGSPAIAYPPAGWVPPAITNLMPVYPPGIPTPPITFDPTYYLTYQYPVMLAERVDIGNPNYIMADPAATQYIANYADLQGADLQSWPGGMNTAGQRVSHKQGTDGILDKARLHWTMYGVAQKRTFLVLSPFNNQPQVGAPIPPVPVAKSSGGFLGTLASIVSIAVPVVSLVAKLSTSSSSKGVSGTGDNPLLSAEEVEVVITGGQIILDILPFYFKSQANGMAAIEMYNEFESLIAQYV